MSNSTSKSKILLHIRRMSLKFVAANLLLAKRPNHQRADNCSKKGHLVGAQDN